MSEHLIMDCDIQWDGAGYQCTICGKLYSVSGIMSAPAPSTEDWKRMAKEAAHRANQDQRKAVGLPTDLRSKIEEIVRDYTSVAYPKTKSELRRRILTLIESEKKRWMKEVLDLVEGMEVGHDPKDATSDKDEDEERGFSIAIKSLKAKLKELP